EHPPAEAARRYVDFMGGAESVLARARACFEDGDYRWVATVVNHMIFADPDNEPAKALQADALEQLGYGAENGTWRNFFLMGAKELREGVKGTPTPTAPPDFVARLSVSQILDAMSLRVNGPLAWDKRISLTFVVTDSDERYALNLENGVLTHLAGREAKNADATLRFERAALNELVAGTSSPPDLFAAGRFQVEGDGAKLGELFSVLDEPDPNFAIVTP
ncbi:MAG: alkyl sulfatase C-terminal domain-containing protein, partial [Solirubrobacterales bacterium]